MRTLNDLPDISFVDEDVNKTVSNLITTYEALSGRKLYPADPVRLFLLAIASILSQQRVLINQTAKEVFLRFARGEIIDFIGEMFNVKRLPADAARVTMEFTLSLPRTSATIIPIGTRIGAQGGGGAIYFATTEVLEIKPGELTGKVLAECSVTGIGGNGFIPGQLNVLIDPIPFVLSVNNTTASSGGAEIESDDAFRERIRAAPESFSTAGPFEAYRFWALTAGSGIVDVGVDSPSPGVITLVPLMADGALPTQDVLDAVLLACHDRRIRPLTDKVSAIAPTTISYNIALTYYINRTRAAESISIQSAVSAAVDKYRLWQKSKLGRDINPSELISRVMTAGAFRLNVTSPVFTDVSSLQVAQDATVTITFGGLVDD
ncbi:baseplate assembly protein [Paenibacillus agilis]|uniref:Baseplate J/gp47 family protein n=1 Tax=Paenibacillus agilis TaxID=3020863 RepID=A0A559IZJ9_9BACL|nr:baseplate J/gp47 family protein [Paenibacillus agilis]TVX93055.1 baseplate J/gp47 family protein [Paenibacillus agilis]